MACDFKRYLDIDVYTAAKQRINQCIDMFDTLMVSFSGGKDSFVMLCLVEEVYRERGITDKIKVVFRDEEIIPDDVIEFIDQIYRSGKYDFRYYAIPLLSQKCVLNKVEPYIQWDPNRRWLRQPPDYAIRLPDGDERVFSQYDADEFICQNEFGTIAMLVGIRADESLKRLNSVINAKEFNWIAESESYGVNLCKPIYDWSEQDIFVYCHKNRQQYCPIYDTQVLNGEPLRVSTSIHAGSVRQFHKIKTGYPRYYQQLIDVFPEMLLQDRYSRQLDMDNTFFAYEKSVNGARQFARDTVTDPVLLQKALKICQTVEYARLDRPPCYENAYGGYPLLNLFRKIAKGQLKHGTITPMCVKKLTGPMIEFEEQAKLEEDAYR